MNKHQVNRGRVPKRTGARTFKIPQISALCLAVAAAMVVSGAPGLGVVPDQRAADPSAAPSYQTVVYLEPVSVSLLSGVDAINFQAPAITSSAADPGTGGRTMKNPSSYQGQGAGPGQTAAPFNGGTTLVGQSVGALGALPGDIQLMHPVSSRHITSPYGWRSNPTGPGTQIHIGQDYAIACGSPVYASANGVVIQSARAGHSGLRVSLDHGSSVRTGYSHNSQLIAKLGDTVKQGQIIALSGTTGNSTGCHVHFEVIVNGRWNDPRNFLPPISGQPNAMIDSRRTTIAAAPIRYAGTARPPVVGGHDFPELTGSTPRRSDPAPVVHRAPPAAPKSQAGPEDKARPEPVPKPKPRPNPEVKPDAKPKPKPEVKPDAKPKPEVKPDAKPKPKPKPKPEGKPSPSPTPKPPASPTPTPEASPPAPTKDPPSKAPTPTTPETTAPETTEPAPTPDPPKTKDPAPEAEAPTTAAPEPGKAPPPVNDVPPLEVHLPDSGTGDGSDDPTQQPDVPKAKLEPPVAQLAPESASPDSGRKPALSTKAPNCEAIPAEDQVQKGAPGPRQATGERCEELEGAVRLD